MRLTETIEPFVLPRAESELLFASAWRTCDGEIPRAAIFSGFSHTRIANVRLPRMSAR